MKHENYIQVLQEHILELRSALFYDMSESVLHLPATVVHTLDLDEAGQLWFIMPRPKQQISEFDTSFPVQLNYFRKNTTRSIQILGRGYIVHDPEELSNWSLLHTELPPIGEGTILVKVRITKAETQEWEGETSPVTKVVNRVLAWLNMNDSGKTVFQIQPSY
jgi:hypothetical protein